VLRSDCYRLTDSHRLVLENDSGSVPFVDLDPRYYKTVHEFDKRFPEGVPSLRDAERLVVEGDWTFGGGVRVVGSGQLDDPGEPALVEPGTTLG
jgi:UTP--glucose-1-phosphate uridylyltransferase